MSNMEGKDKLDELLVSYLLNELDAEDDELILAWLNADDNNRIYLEELKQTLNLIRLGDVTDKVNLEAEWDRFDKARQGEEQKSVFVNDAERFGNEIIKEVRLKRKTNIYRTIALTAVAACIILAIGLGWSLIGREEPGQQKIAETTKKVDVAPGPEIRNLVNNTGKATRYELEDGTTVLLYSKSQLSFPEPFELNKRDLQLKGKAEFRVAKNKLKPFTVFSGDIATTALGTRFSVTAFEKSNNVSVRLFEGKVVVKSMVANQTHKKDYFLIPGQELVYNRPKEETIVWAFNTAPVPAKPAPSVVDADNPSVPKYGTTSWYMFNNQPLTEVFDQLAEMHNVEIIYSKKDVSRMYFIGTFEKADSLRGKADSLGGILTHITKLNKLKLIRENNKYIIRKK